MGNMPIVLFFVQCKDKMNNFNLQIYFNLISFFIVENLFADATVLCILTNISAAPSQNGFESQPVHPGCLYSLK